MNSIQKAALYMRLSKEDLDKGNAESESIQNQRMILDEYASSHGWEIYDHYLDEDFSGSDRSRPDFNRMIEDAKNGKFNIVLVKTQSRFARDIKVVEDYIHNLFKEKKIRFVSALEGIDTMRSDSELSSHIHAVFDETQLTLLSQNIRRSFDEKAKRGQFFGSMPPFGYKKDPNNKNHLIIDEDAAPVVRTIFEMVAAGSTYMQIAQHLNSCGYLIPSEYKKQHGYKVNGMYDRHMKIGKWTRDMVRTFISNEVYIGTVVNHKSTVLNFRTKKKGNVPKSEHIKIPNMHEPIIDINLWNTVQKLRQTRSKASSGKDGKKHPLSGKVYCEKCGSKMYKCKSGGISYFRCYRASSTGECDNHKRIRLDMLEKTIIDKINETISQYVNQDELSENIVIINRLDKKLESLKNQRFNIEKSLETTRKNLLNLLKSYNDGVVIREIYEQAQNDYMEQQNATKTKLKNIDVEINDVQTKIENQEDKEEILKKYTHIDKLTIPIVQEFIDSIFISEVTKDGQRNITINMAI